MIHNKFGLNIFGLVSFYTFVFYVLLYFLKSHNATDLLILPKDENKYEDWRKRSQRQRTQTHTNTYDVNTDITCSAQCILFKFMRNLIKKLKAISAFSHFCYFTVERNFILIWTQTVKHMVKFDMVSWWS